MNEDVASPAEHTAEVGVAHERGEANIWVKVLNDMGIDSSTETLGTVWTAILYLGRRPVSVLVDPKDLERAQARLKELRLIQ